MADYKATSAEFTAVANAIRIKGGTQEQLEWPTGFSSAIEAIPSGGTLIEKSITQNGTYNANDDNADGYSKVVINVSGGGFPYGNPVGIFDLSQLDLTWNNTAGEGE